MAQNEQLNVHDIVWSFSVTDPRLHSKGFTVYKVSCKCFSVKCPELITELVCWKRYNDFKLLYKSLMTLHKIQHGNDPFPDFVKPTIFGRFTENVIEKRRLSAVELLNFISTHPNLYKSDIFKHFLEEGRVQSDFNKRGSLLVSRSSKSNVISCGLKVDADTKAQITQAHLNLDNKEKVKLDPSAPLAEKPGTDNSQQTTHLMREDEPLAHGKIEQTVLQGTWNFPQVADDVSLGSSTEDEIVDADDDLASASSLPDADLTSFDTRSHSSAKAVMGKSNSESTNWLQEGLNMCAGEFIQELPTKTMTLETSDNRDQALDAESALAASSFSTQDNIQADPGAAASSNKNETLGKSIDLEECEPIPEAFQCTVSSKTECGKGDLDLSVELYMRTSSCGSDATTSSWGSQDVAFTQTHDLSNTLRSSFETSWSIESDLSEASSKMLGQKSTQTQTSKSLLKSLVSGKSVLNRPRSVTEQSVSTMSLGGKDDYIYRAANQISKAQNSEANGNYEVAFAYYKSGVGILLHGVQGDTNKYRRDAVRRKTAKYLMKAEDLYNRHLADDSNGELRWGMDSFLSPSLDPSFAFIRGSAKELHNFQVLGTIDKVILVRHKVTDETFVIKSIPKSTLDTGSAQSILPTSCPYMVSLHRFFETEDSVFLLLQYASGGKLWTYIGDYLYGEKNVRANWGEDKVDAEDARNVCSENRWETQHKSENIYQGFSYLSGVMTNCETRSVDENLKSSSQKQLQDLESSSQKQLLNGSDIVRYPELSSEIGHVDATVQSARSYDIVGSFHVVQGMDVNHSCGDILTVTDSVNHGFGNKDIITDSNNTTSSALQDFASFSDKCASVGEQDSSVITPVSLLDEESFHSLLQKNLATSQASSGGSAANDVMDHCVSTCEKVKDILSGTEHWRSPEQMLSDQTSSYTVFHLPEKEDNSEESGDNLYSISATGNAVIAENSEDIIRKSKELLIDVNRVIEETNNRTSFSHSQIKPACQTSLYNTEGNVKETSVYNSEGNVKETSVYNSEGNVKETSVYNSEENVEGDDTEKSSSHNISKISDHKCVGTLLDELCDGEDQNNLTSAEFVSAKDTNYPRNTSVSSSVQGATPTSATSLEERRKNLSQSFTGSTGSLFKQAGTPQRLSLSHLSCKGVTRSSSLESDFRSPLHNRTRAVSDSYEQVDTSSVDTVQIPESLIKKWIAQMVTAVSRLHSLGVICRDLKPSNVLLGDGGQVFLTYFCNLGHGDQEFDWAAKDNFYAAPEVGSVNKYDGSCDWWSIGALLFELVVGRSLSECHPGGINSHTCLHIPAFVSNETRALLHGLLCHNPNERLGSGMAGSEEIKAHPFFTGVDWHALQYS